MKKTKRLLAMLLTLMLCMGEISSTGLTVFAAGDEEELPAAGAERETSVKEEETTVPEVETEDVCQAPVNAEGVTEDGFKYQVNEDGITVTITGYEQPGDFKQGQKLNLPDIVTVDGEELKVTIIGEKAFYSNPDDDQYKWSGLKLPAYLVKIEESAFYSNIYMTGELIFPDSVTAIGEGAFEKCAGFEKLLLPICLKEIGPSAFSGCKGFRGELLLPTSLTDIGSSAFSGCLGFSGTLTIPSTVEKIGNYAFSGCSGFTGDLEIPLSVETIGDSAFAGIYLYGKLVLPSNVTSIGKYAFEDSYFKQIENSTDLLTCDSIFGHDPYNSFYTYGKTSETVLSDLQVGVKIPTGTSYRYFSSNSGGSHNYINDAGYIYEVKEDKVKICFYENIAQGALNVPDTLGGKDVTEIGAKAFVKCGGFTGNLKLPEKLEKIGENAFYKCHNLTGELKIPDTVTTINTSAFAYCESLTGDVVIPSKVTTLPYYCFQGCKSLDGTLVLNPVTNIGMYCFDGCSSLTGDVNIPSGCQVQGNAFKGCVNLNGTLTVPADAKLADWCLHGTLFKHIVNNSEVNIPVMQILMTDNETYYCKDGADQTEVDEIGKGSYHLKMPIKSAVITLNGGDTYIFDGTPVKPEVTITVNGIKLKKDTDYTLDYKNADALGTATVVVTGSGNYYGTAQKTYNIIGGTILPIDDIPDQVYTGEEIKPTITFGGISLKEGEDYAVIYLNNVNVGNASVTAVGKGLYSFTYVKSFKIVPASISIAVISDIPEQLYTGDEIKPACTVTLGSNQLEADTDYTLTYNNNINTGTATVTATGKGNYTDTVSKNFIIKEIAKSVADSALDNRPVISDTTTDIYLVKGQKFYIGMEWKVADDKVSKKYISINKKGILEAKKAPHNSDTMTIKKEGHPDITVHICQPALSDKKKTLEITETEQNPTHTLTITKDAGIKNVLWYSASPDVATVDQTGKVTAVAKGKANITAYVNGCAYNCTITVKETAVARNRTLHVNTDTSKTISVKGIKKWESASENIAEMNKKKGNKVMAKNVGKTTLTASANGVDYSIDFYAEDITVSCSNVRFAKAKESNKYSIVNMKTNDTADIELPGVVQDVVFKSNKPDVAFIDEEGHIEARGKGTAKLTTKINGKTITVTVKVME